MKIILIKLIIAVSIVGTFSQEQYIPIKWPEIANETVVDEYQDIILSIARMNLNVTALPIYAQNDGHEIQNELAENLHECREQLLTDHILWQYKVCVNQYLDTTNTHIWELINSIKDLDDDDDSSNSARFTILTALIMTNLMLLKNI